MNNKSLSLKYKDFLNKKDVTSIEEYSNILNDELLEEFIKDNLMFFKNYKELYNFGNHLMNIKDYIEFENEKFNIIVKGKRIGSFILKKVDELYGMLDDDDDLDDDRKNVRFLFLSNKNNLFILTLGSFYLENLEKIENL